MLFLSFALAIPARDTAVPVFPDADRDGWDVFSDCDDLNAAVYPTALDICDGLDNDCNGGVDDPLPGLYYLYPDRDADGWGDPSADAFQDPPSCPPPAHFTIRIGDCDDFDAARHPDVLDDDCDGVDDDCDGFPDDDAPGAGYHYYDTDGDGHAGGGGYGCPGPGAVSTFDDCDDSDPTVFVGAVEVFGDGVDQDCNGLDDPWPDADGDGYPQNVDCDEASVSINPGATEACGNRLDDDCDGAVDEGCTDEVPAPTPACGCAASPTPSLLSWLTRRRAAASTSGTR